MKKLILAVLLLALVPGLCLADNPSGVHSKAFKQNFGQVYYINWYQNDLEKAISDLGSTEADLVINRTTEALTANTTVPVNIRLVVEKGGYITTSTYTLTINGDLEAGRYQIWANNAVIVYGDPVDEVFPEWYGGIPSSAGGTDISTALQTAIDDCGQYEKELYFGEGYYYHASKLTATYWPNWRGLGAEATRLGAQASGLEDNAIEINGADTEEGWIRDMAIEGSTQYCDHAVYVKNGSFINGTFENVEIMGCSGSVASADGIAFANEGTSNAGIRFLNCRVWGSYVNIKLIGQCANFLIANSEITKYSETGIQVGDGATGRVYKGVIDHCGIATAQTQTGASTGILINGATGLQINSPDIESENSADSRSIKLASNANHWPNFVSVYDFRSTENSEADGAVELPTDGRSLTVLNLYGSYVEDEHLESPIIGLGSPNTFVFSDGGNIRVGPQKYNDTYLIPGPLVMPGFGSGTHENLLLYSEQFDNAAWVSSSGAGESVTANTLTAPDGSTTGDEYAPGVNRYFYQDSNSGDQAGNTATFGLWVKSDTGGMIALNLYADGGTNSYSLTVPITTEWSYQSITQLIPVGETGDLQCVVVTTGNGIPSPLSEIHVWGAQLTINNGPTGYLPTASAAAGEVSGTTAQNIIMREIDGTVDPTPGHMTIVSRSDHTVSVVEPDGTEHTIAGATKPIPVIIGLVNTDTDVATSTGSPMFPCDSAWDGLTYYDSYSRVYTAGSGAGYCNLQMFRQTLAGANACVYSKTFEDGDTVPSSEDYTATTLSTGDALWWSITTTLDTAPKGLSNTVTFRK